METDVEVVLLTTPPHFRPMHLKAAIDAGKHVFCEKPVAVDAPGVRSVLETTEKAREKGLAIVSVTARLVATHGSTIVFTRTKHRADRIGRQLHAAGVSAAVLHGGHSQNKRDAALARFADGQVQALVATDVAARGIHVDDIDVVVHFDLPEDHKGFVHRSGRTARAGRTGAVATFVLWNQLLDVEKLQKRLGLSEPVIEVFSNDARLLDLAGSSEAVAS
jgi:superfamily II DNA/RNA helicase